MSVLDVCSCVQSLDSWPLIKRLLENFREALCLQNNFFFCWEIFELELPEEICNLPRLQNSLFLSSSDRFCCWKHQDVRLKEDTSWECELSSSVQVCFYLTRNDCRLLGKEIVLGREMEIILRAGGETRRNMRWILESNWSWSED